MLPSVGFKITDLLDPDFLATLAGPSIAVPSGGLAASLSATPEPAALAALAGRLLDLAGLAPQARGFAFESFLTDLFQSYGLAPRGSFRPREGEQIDGSFELDNDTYLVEAKWASGAFKYHLHGRLRPSSNPQPGTAARPRHCAQGTAGSGNR
ncbi:hypothetical protein [Rhizobium sp. SJZ105]|uniref:hypothetical protein n=1 Tax=Rhizobium sp. SJZ105 TaxID=2572678 RepID=UPI002AA53848|nr:hypothetical protein [Rhizobium sp. SJZ105]